MVPLVVLDDVLVLEALGELAQEEEEEGWRRESRNSGAIDDEGASVEFEPLGRDLRRDVVQLVAEPPDEATVRLFGRGSAELPPPSRED